MQCAANPGGLNSQAGAVGILHTWGQTLVYHPRIHKIVPAGRHSADEMEWVPSSNKFFLTVKILRKVFRGILCWLLEQAISKGDINLPDRMQDFSGTKKLCYLKNRVVFCQKLFANANSIFQ